MSSPPIVIQAPAPATPPAVSSGKKIITFIIFIILLSVGVVYANLNGYITLPESITKFIPVDYLPATEIAAVEEAPAAEAPAETYKEEPETYEEEMAKYEKESYKDETETYEEEKYVDEPGKPEAYTP